MASRLDTQEKHTEEALRTPTLLTLEDLQAEWGSVGRQLPGWRKTLTTRAAEVETAISRLKSLEELWQLTQREARQDDAPTAIVERTEQVLTGIAAVRVLARERRSDLLTLQAAVAAQANRVESTQDSLEELRRQLVSRVFEADDVPVWSPELRDRLVEGFGERLAAESLKETADLQAFAATNQRALALHCGVFFVFLLLLYSARRRVRARTEEEKGLGRVAEVFELPVSVALLLALLATPWIYPFVPPAVAQILGAAALVPTVVIARRFTAAPLLPLLNALVVFYFVDRVRELLSSLPELARLIFLAEMGAGILFLAWLLNPSRLADMPEAAGRNRLLRLLGLASRAALGLLVIAFVADALGLRRLGLLVGGATLSSAYVGLIAYTAVRILDSLVTFALRVRPLGALGMVQRGRYTMRRKIHRVLVFGATATWAAVTLEFLAIRRPLFETARAVLTAKLAFGAVSLSLGDVLAFVVTIWLAFLISRFVRFVLEEDIYPRLQLGRGVPYAASTLTHYILLLAGFILAVAATGIDLNRFTILAGAFGVGIGFGLQNVVNNFVSGLILLSERPVQVGDTIEAGDALGDVKRIGIRSSTVRTWSGAELIVPNSELISERVINWSLSDRQRRLDVSVGVAYGTDRRQVLDLLVGVAVADPDVLDSPPPVPLFRGFGSSSLDFELRAWTNRLEAFARVQSNLLVAISYALDEAGIEVPFPQRDLHLRSVDQRAAALLTTGDEPDE